MKVYILTDNEIPKRLEVLTSRCLSTGFEVEVLTEIGELDIDNDVIISTNEFFQSVIFQKYLIMNTYQILNDKCMFYDYLKENTDLLEGIELIPSYDQTYDGPSFTNKFLIKDKLGWSSMFNKTIEGDVYDLIAEYGQTNQIQDIIDVKHIYGVSCSCSFGKILGVYSYKTFEGITPESYVTGFDAIRGNYVDIPVVREFLKNIFSRFIYNGIVEMEFIIDKNENIFIMECNPRISGSLMVPPYFDWVIMPYLNCLMTRNIVEIDLEDQSLWQNT